jgi:hypothetical protein
MLPMGALLVTGSTASNFATNIFPFDRYMGINASIAGVAFGVGIAIASFDPEGNLSWLRGGIIYADLLVAYQVVFWIFVGVPLSWGPLLLGVGFASSLVLLYPRRPELIPTSRVNAVGVSNLRFYQQPGGGAFKTRPGLDPEQVVGAKRDYGCPGGRRQAPTG